MYSSVLKGVLGAKTEENCDLKDCRLLSTPLVSSAASKSQHALNMSNPGLELASAKIVIVEGKQGIALGIKP